MFQKVQKSPFSKFHPRHIPGLCDKQETEPKVTSVRLNQKDHESPCSLSPDKSSQTGHYRVLHKFVTTFQTCFYTGLRPFYQLKPGLIAKVLGEV
jgi:hypothetical protein